MTRHGTSIPWTHAPGYIGEVWNVVTGCTPVSRGCAICYARVLHNRRHLAWRRGCWLTSRPAPAQYHQPFSKVQLFPDRLDQPLRWRSPRMVMTPSMGDLFHEDVPFGFLDEVFNVAIQAPQHLYLFLTKRPERMRDYMNPEWAPLPNVWLGVSVEDRDSADERIPLLLDTPAAKRFVSAEPLLGPIDLFCWLPPYGQGWTDRPNIDWLIVGGESGRRHRPMNLAWVEALKAQCDAAKVPMFGKQAAGNRSGILLPGRLGERSWPL